MLGEGTRGGVVIGHTRAGNPVYQDAKPEAASYRPFLPGDHASAALVHEKAAAATKDPAMSLHHRNLASAHRVFYEKAVARSRKPDVVYGHSRDYKSHAFAKARGLYRRPTGDDVRAALRSYLRGDRAAD